MPTHRLQVSGTVLWCGLFEEVATFQKIIWSKEDFWEEIFFYDNSPWALQVYQVDCHYLERNV